MKTLQAVTLTLRLTSGATSALPDGLVPALTGAGTLLGDWRAVDAVRAPAVAGASVRAALRC